jgi:hypothetical protein
MNIVPVSSGIPSKICTQLKMFANFDLEAPTVLIYYQVLTAEGERVEEGNLILTSEQFLNWGVNSKIVIDIILGLLGLTEGEPTTTTSSTTEELTTTTSTTIVEPTTTTTNTTV